MDDAAAAMGMGIGVSSKSSKVFSGRSTRLSMLAFLALTVGGHSAHAAHGFALYGTPRYPTDFQHFDYVNPDAPKGGTLTLANAPQGANTPQSTGFDKLNPYSLKGVPAPGLLDLVFETLAVYSLDELNTQYGLLADDIAVAPDFGSVTFHINPKAKFSNGDPVTARDVKYSFDTLSGRRASPKFRTYFADIDKAVLIDPATIRFDYRRKGRDLAFVVGNLPVFSPKWGAKPGGGHVPFDELRMEKPIASGPYVVEQTVEDRGITFRRNPGYWGSDIPTRRGSYNFDRVVYKLYKDQDTLISALRKGEFDAWCTPQSRIWYFVLRGGRLDDGELVKEDFPNKNPGAMIGYAVNLRRKQFQDIRVRKALDLAFDFEWVNQRIFKDDWIRTQSFFPASPLAATGLPSAAELTVLEPYRDQLDPAVFGPMVVQPTTRPPSSYRQNLAKALELMSEAGWHYRDGYLRNDKGEPFVMEVTLARGTGASVMTDALYLNFSKLGIQLKRVASDAATDRLRMNNFDYGFTSVTFREARQPGAEMLRNLDSAEADKPGSDNIIGVKSPVVDALIRRLIDAQSEQELETAGRALDRVLIHSYYVIPFRHINTFHIIHGRDFAYPSKVPDYYGAYEWIQATWWKKR